MGDFSMEYYSEKIYNSRTKEYFKEVLRCYINGSYRSAIVMLYSITICDLVYKLEDLKDLYNDQTAEGILDDIIEDQRSHPNSPEWETNLIQYIKDRTKILEVSEYKNIISLQQHRHLCAHPIMDQNYILYSPNKETVRAHIRNILEGVLIKPPIFSAKILGTLVEDLSSKKDILTSNEDLERYLNSKYLKSINTQVELSVFKNLWKFVFRLTNEECTINRDINYRSIKVIYTRRKNEIQNLIKSNINYFSEITSGEPTKYLIKFLSDNYEIYSLLSDNAKVQIEQEARNDRKLYPIAWFISNNIEEHILDARDLYEPETWVHEFNDSFIALNEIACTLDSINVFNETLINMFGDSESFDEADSKYNTFISPYLKQFTRDNLILLLEKIQHNSQISYRREAKNSNREIKGFCDNVLGEEFDYTTYDRFIDEI